MKDLESIIKLALKEDLKGEGLEKTSACPAASELADYASGGLPRKRQKELEAHLAGCLACMEDIMLAKKAEGFYMKETKSGGNFGNWLKKSLWLILAIASFVLSFAYPRYFLQYLVATLVLGAKWILETTNARILIMIYEAWKKGGEAELGRVLERFESRMK